MDKTFTVGRARRRAGDRLQHLPHLERLPGPVREPGHRQPGRSSSRTRRAVLPLAITVQIAREVLAEAGFDPNLVTLAVEEPGDAHRRRPGHPPATCGSSTSPAPASSATGWRPTPARPSSTPRRPGLNTVVVDSTDDYTGLLRNLAFSLSLYSGQMCTTPQNLLVPPRRHRHRRRAPQSPTSSRADLAAALDKLLGDPARAAGTLGAIVNDGVLARLEAGGRGSAYGAARRRRRAPRASRTPSSARRWWCGSTPGRREGVHPRVVRAGLLRHRHRLHRAQPRDLPRDRAATTAR